MLQTSIQGPVGPLTIVRRALLSLSAALLAIVAGLVPMAPAHAADDPYSGEQWALTKVGAPTAWATTTGSGVKIGIVDTGIDIHHQDLAGKIAAFADCTGSGPCVDGAGVDDNGHGTHVAGIAAAVTGNGVGISGMAPNATLVVAKALDADGGGTVQNVDEGIRWVVDQGAQVVNLSLGPEIAALGVLGGEALGPAVAYAWSKGAVPVISAGNDSTIIGSSNYQKLDAIVVGATGPDDTVASYSSAIDAKYGIVAPGGDGDCNPATGGAQRCILSTYFNNNRYALMRGTSMAAPQVAGAAALVLAQGFGRDDTVQRLLGNADKAVSCGTNCSGRLDVAAAVDPSRPTPSPPPPVTTDNSGPPAAVIANPDPSPTVTQPGDGGGGSPAPTTPTTPAGGEPSPPDSGSVSLPADEPAIVIVPPAAGSSPGPAPIPAPPPAPAATGAPSPPVTPGEEVVLPQPGASAPPPPPTASPSSGFDTSHSAPVPDQTGSAPPPAADGTTASNPEIPGSAPAAASAPGPDPSRPLLRLRITNPAGNYQALLGLGLAGLLVGGAARVVSVRRRAGLVMATRPGLGARPGPDITLPVTLGPS